MHVGARHIPGRAHQRDKMSQLRIGRSFRFSFVTTELAQVIPLIFDTSFYEKLISTVPAAVVISIFKQQTKFLFYRRFVL